jgi:hypothetical protein
VNLSSLAAGMPTAQHDYQIMLTLTRKTWPTCKTY